MQRLIAAINEAKANFFVVIVMTNQINLFKYLESLLTEIMIFFFIKNLLLYQKDYML